MRAGRATETIGALAGVALAVLVFLPWWSFDPASAEAAPGPPQLVAIAVIGVSAAAALRRT